LWERPRAGERGEEELELVCVEELGVLVGWERLTAGEEAGCNGDR
jgi:hypothetical protein